MLVGVRTNAPEALDALRHRVGWEAHDGLAGPVAYSLVVAAETGRGAQRLHTVRYGQCALHRSRSIDTIVRALEQAIGSHDLRGGSLVASSSLAVIGRLGAVLGPHYLVHRLDELRHELRRAGLRIVVGDRVRLDLSARQLVVPGDPGSPFAAASGQEVELATPGLHPLVGWVEWRVREEGRRRSQVVRGFLGRLGPLSEWCDREKFLAAVSVASHLPRLDRTGSGREMVQHLARLANG